MKLGGSSPTQAQPAPVTAPPPAPELDTNPEAQAPSDGGNDKPFDDKPFDAGVEADEATDPKKFIEQLSGKLGQSLRKYTETTGNPDFELEKFVVNSALAATHTSEMDPQDQNDIIKKVKEAGKGDEVSSEPGEEPSQEPSMEPASDDTPTDEPSDGINESAEDEEDNGFFLENPKKLSIFAPKGSKESKFKHIQSKLRESFKQNDMEPTTAPKPTITEPKPSVQPNQPSIKPSRRNRPYMPVTPAPNPSPKADTKIAEVKKGGPKYEIYHDTFSQAVQEAEAYALSCGYTVNENDWFNQINTGSGKPAEGETKRFSIELMKGDKETNKKLNIQVYGMKQLYELNCYVS